jgi:uncharacterized membrane protein
MPTSTEAEEHLRVIRSLMEKATVYRAISAPAALLGGSVAVAVAATASLWSGGQASLPFIPTWLVVLGLTSVANFWLLRRDALRRGEAFFSAGMRLALRAMLPALLAGGLALCLPALVGAPVIASLWVLLYGVSLLAAAHFAPRSIRFLGRVFFSSGALLLLAGSLTLNHWLGTNQQCVAHSIMGATFGLFHLIYAACTWPRRSASGA